MMQVDSRQRRPAATTPAAAAAPLQPGLALTSASWQAQRQRIRMNAAHKVERQIAMIWDELGLPDLAPLQQMASGGLGSGILDYDDFGDDDEDGLSLLHDVLSAPLLGGSGMPSSAGGGAASADTAQGRSSATVSNHAARQGSSFLEFAHEMSGTVQHTPQPASRAGHNTATKHGSTNLSHAAVRVVPNSAGTRQPSAVDISNAGDGVVAPHSETALWAQGGGNYAAPAGSHTPEPAFASSHAPCMDRLGDFPGADAPGYAGTATNAVHHAGHTFTARLVAAAGAAGAQPPKVPRWVREGLLGSSRVSSGQQRVRGRAAGGDCDTIGEVYNGEPLSKRRRMLEAEVRQGTGCTHAVLCVLLA